MDDRGGDAPSPDDLLEAYLRDIEQVPPLTDARESELMRAIERGEYILRLRARLSHPDHLGRDSGRGRGRIRDLRRVQALVAPRRCPA